MSDAAVKEARVIMRQVQDHLQHAHLKLGATCDTVGFVDVIHHPTNPYFALNYVTPRRNTAWVSGNHVKAGLDHIRELGRTPRIYFVEGLYPPIFVKTLRDLGLKLEYEMPIMVYKVDKEHPFKPPTLPDQVTISPATDQEGISLWWYIWRNAFYDVFATGVEPLYVGRDMREVTTGGQLDLIMYRYGQPIGVARVTLYEQTGHISAQALMKDIRTPELTQMLQAHALKAALDKGCEMVFVSGESDENRQFSREMGFIDSGSVVCYAETSDESQEETNGTMEQSVLIL